MKTCGIYKILNSVSGRVYVGSSHDVALRWAKHRQALRRKSHHCQHLQRAWNSHGEAAFSLVVIEECAPEVLVQRENHHIAEQRASAPLYNTAPASPSTLGMRFGPMAEEIRRKIAASHIGIRPDEAARAKMSASAKRRPAVKEATRQKFVAHMTGRKMKPLSEEHRRQISMVHKGKTISEEHRAALSRAHKGRPLSDEHKRKKSEAAKRQHARARAARTAQAASISGVTICSDALPKMS